MYKPFANAKILLVWINGKQAGRMQYSWKNALANANKYKCDIFATNQIEILDIETGEIIMVQKGVKQQVTPPIVHPK